MADNNSLYDALQKMKDYVSGKDIIENDPVHLEIQKRTEQQIPEKDQTIHVKYQK